MGAPRGRPPTPCPRCGKGKREFQLLVQSRPVGGTADFLKGGLPEQMSSSVTVCATCAGQLRAKLTILLQSEAYGTPSGS